MSVSQSSMIDSMELVERKEGMILMLRRTSDGVLAIVIDSEHG